MSFKLHKADQAGFTIIEVLFVLAIAGVIMMIVFQAIPAVIRGGRNNQRKQDVATILQAVSHYELNNSGIIPQNDCGKPPQTPCSQSLGVNSPDNFLKYVAGKLTFYDPTVNDPTSSLYQVTFKGGNTTVTVGPVNSVNLVQVYNYYKCDPDTLGVARTGGASYNDVVALYAIESGSGHTSQCQQL